MKLLSCIILSGASFWGDKPVAKCVLEIPDFSTSEKLLLAERWQYCQKLFPSLANLQFNPEEFVLSFALLAFNLQTHGRHEPDSLDEILRTADKNITVGVPFEISDKALPACKAACYILNPKTTIAATANSSIDQQALTSQIITRYRKSVRHLEIYYDPEWLARQFRKRDVPCTHIFDNFFLLGQGKYQSKFYHSYGKDTSYLAVQLSTNKQFANHLLGKANLPVAKQHSAPSLASAVSIAGDIGYPVVMKPNNGKKGQDVFVNLNSEEEVTQAFQRLTKAKRQVIVERFISGDEYRLLVIGGKFVAAMNRQPGRITGDGTRSIRQLLAARNKHVRGYDLRNMFLDRLLFDSVAKEMMEDRGYTLDSCLKKDEVLVLRKVSNLSAGGTSRDVTAMVHPDNIALAERAAKTVGLDIMGVDFLTTDISKSYHQTGGAICEVNACPGLRGHYAATEGPLHDVASPILELHYPNGVCSRMINILLVGETVPDKAANDAYEWLIKRNYCPGFYEDGVVLLATDEPELKNQTPLSTAELFIRHAELDVSLWSMDYSIICETGLPMDQVDLVIDQGNLEKSGMALSLDKFLRENSEAYELISNDPISALSNFFSKTNITI